MAVNDPSLADVEFGPAAGSTLSDAELIAATRAGDADAFAVLYERHADAARACARRLTRSRADADDLVAEAFAKVLSALRRGKGPDLAFRPYLLTSVRNALYDRTRRDSRVEFTDEPPEPVNATLLSADYAREDQAMVAQAYASLPERWQMVLWHTDVEGRPPAEIAPLLGISANSVAALAYRAREGLRQAYLSAHVNKGMSDGCKGTADKLSAFVRDGLSARDRRGVEEHLAGCAACTALLAELQEANKSLKIVLIPVLAGIPAAAYLSGMSTGGITKLVRRHPASVAAAAVAAAAAVVFAAVVLSAPGSEDAADALTVPPIGSGRPTTTTTTTTTTPLPTAPVTVAPTATISRSTAPFTVPVFDTAIPPITAVPFNPNATTVTTVRRTNTTVRSATTTTRPTTTEAEWPDETETTTTTTTTEAPAETTTTTTTTIPVVPPPVTPPAITSSVEGIGPMYSGQTAYFRIVVSNGASGNLGAARFVAVGPADGVVVEFNVPTGASFLGPVSGDWQCDRSGSTVRCLLPRVESGATKEAIFSLDVSATADTKLTISPVVWVNGARTDSLPIERTVVDGSDIADFSVFPGAALALAGNTVSSCTIAPTEPPTVDHNCDNAGSVRSLLPSSSANLDLSDSPVQQAFLVWQGQGDGTQPVQLTVPGGAAATVSGSLTRVSGTEFVAVADVTTHVQAGGAGSYTVAGVPAGLGANSFGGWSLIVITNDGSGAWRGFQLSLPFSWVDGSAIATAEGLSPMAAARNVLATVMVGEGDQDPIDGSPADDGTKEQILVNGTPVFGYVHVDDGTGNVYKSRVIGLPDVSTFGLDLDVFPAAVEGDAPIAVTATTGRDGVIVSAVGLLYDL